MACGTGGRLGANSAPKQKKTRFFPLARARVVIQYLK